MDESLAAINLWPADSPSITINHHIPSLLSQVLQRLMNCITVNNS
jgi:hypothetical protein